MYPEVLEPGFSKGDEELRKKLEENYPTTLGFEPTAVEDIYNARERDKWENEPKPYIWD